jgi:parallel beta-helix repeat protein
MANDQDDAFNASKAEVFDALGHPTRIRLLQTLSGNPLPFSELKRAAGLESNGLLTFHLGRLRGLVRLSPEGVYTLTDEGSEALRMIEASRTMHAEPKLARPAFRLSQHKAFLTGLVVFLVVLMIFGAFFGYTYVTDTNRISSLNATIAADDAKITADNSLISKLQGNVSFLQSQLSLDQSTIQSTIQSTSNQVSSLESQLLQDTSAIQSLSNQISSLKSQLSSFQAGCGLIITSDMTLSHNIGPCSGNGLVIGASHIVFDCAGHSIIGTGANATSVGINLTGITKAVIKNCQVTGFQLGFLLNSSSGNTLTMDTASKDGYGFELSSSSGNTLVGNLASNDEDSFDLGYSSNNNSLNMNTANSDDFGFALFYSSNSNILSGNTASNNSHFGIALDLSSYNTLTMNTSDNNTVNGFFLKYSSDDNAFSGNTANGNGLDGFYVYSSSSNNTFTGNTASNNTQYGYYDLSTGSGTAGTGNSYSGDKCEVNGIGGSSPTGLGTPQS